MTFLKKTLLATVLLVGHAQAQNIYQLSAQTQGDSTELRISFDDLPVMPTAYLNNNRLVLDFNQVGAANLARSTLINTGMIGEVTTVVSGDTTRLMVDLNGASNYEVGTDGNDLLIQVQNTALKSPLVTSSVGRQVQSVNVNNNPLLNSSNISNRNYNYDGITALSLSGNQITARLSSESIPVDVQRQGNRLVIRTQGATIPRSLLRHINGSGLVKSIDAVNQSQNGVVTITMNGDFEYQAYQSGTSLNITVTEPALLREPTLEEKKYTGQPLSVEFQDLPVRVVLDALAKFTDMNIVASDAVQGNITLRLTNVPWDQALDIVLKSKNLGKRQNENVILVAPALELAEQEAKELEAQRKVTTFEPLRTEYIRLNYAQAQAVFDLFEKVGSNRTRGINRDDSYNRDEAGLLSDRGSVVVDVRTNTLIVKDTAKSIENIRAMIEKIDIPVQQVMIEARIVNASEGFSKELGVRWGVLSQNRNMFTGGSYKTLGEAQNIRSELATTGKSSGKISHGTDSLSVNLGAISPTASRIAFTLLNISDSLLDVELSAMQADNRGEVISAPKVITANQQTARISSGVQVPYQVATASGATSVEFREAALVLEATPNITPEGKVGLKLDIRNGIAQGVGTAALRIDEDQLQTNVVVDDGQTVVLGGVFRNTRSTSADKVPFFGDLPYVGRMFKRDVRSDTKQELLIFVTPKIVNQNVARY